MTKSIVTALTYEEMAVIIQAIMKEIDKRESGFVDVTIACECWENLFKGTEGLIKLSKLQFEGPRDEL